MAVVRLDDELLKKLKEILKKEDNKYKYSSIASFINSIVYDKIKSEVKK
ncbi:MAG: hypothetical protein Q8L27_03910 [archaeon]|nr:hypothetical protein [archaeon]